MTKKETPEAAHGYQGEMNQIDSTTKPEQVSSEILSEITEMHKRFREIYEDGYRIAGIDSSVGVQLSSDAFLDTFDKYESAWRSSPDYPFEIFAEFNGVRIFAVLSKEERECISV